MLNIVLILITIIFVNMLIKSFPRLKTQYLGVDIFTHLYITNEMRKQNGMPKYLDKYIIDKYHNAPLSYPMFLHFILKFFPFKYTDKWNKYIMPIVNTIDLVILFSFSYLILKNHNLAFTISILYMFLPNIFKEVQSLTPRPLGILQVNLSLIGLILFGVTHNYFWFVLAVLISTQIFFTHKFALQAFICALIFLFISAEMIIPILSLLVIDFTILLIFFRNIYFERILFCDHIIALRWHKNNFNGIIEFAQQFKKNKELTRSITKNIISYIINNPFTIILLVFISIDLQFFLDNYLHRVLLVWFLGLELTFFLTTSVNKFRFLGEGWRYKDYNGFPCIFLFVVYIFSHINILNICLIAFSFSIELLNVLRIAEKFIRLQDSSISYNQEIKEICNFLKGLPKQNIWCLPSGISSMIMYFTNKSVLGVLSPKALINEPNLYPVVKEEYKSIIKRFNIDYLLIEKNTSVDIDSTSIYKQIFETSNYSIREV